MMYYTYIHHRVSDGKPFYIGKGIHRRAWSSKNRNPHWRHTVAKHGLQVELLANWSTEQEALDHERFLIWCFRDLGHDLCNLTDGGEGVSGWTPAPQTRELWSRQRTGKGNHRFGKSGEKSALYGKPLSPEHKQKLSCAFSGEKNPMHGTVRPKEVRDKISQKKLGVPQPKRQVAVECVETGQRFASLKAAAAWAAGSETKHANIIRSAKSGATKTAYGYRWKYL